jgi:hypothetical protein
MLLDHQGWNAMRNVETVSEDELIALAKKWHVFRLLPVDRRWAREIIDNAVAMAASSESSGPLKRHS